MKDIRIDGSLKGAIDKLCISELFEADRFLSGLVELLPEYGNFKNILAYIKVVTAARSGG